MRFLTCFSGFPAPAVVWEINLRAMTLLTITNYMPFIHMVDCYFVALPLRKVGYAPSEHRNSLLINGAWCFNRRTLCAALPTYAHELLSSGALSLSSAVAPAPVSFLPKRPGTTTSSDMRIRQPIRTNAKIHWKAITCVAS